MIEIVFLSNAGQEKSTCKDELVASEEHSKLFSTCGDHSSAVAVLSEGYRLNVTLIPRSRLAYPKRGFLIYYRGKWILLQTERFIKL